MSWRKSGRLVVVGVVFYVVTRWAVRWVVED